MSQNKEMAAMLVPQTKPLGIELYFYANTFFCFSKPNMAGSHVNENTLYVFVCLFGLDPAQTIVEFGMLEQLTNRKAFVKIFLYIQLWCEP